MSADMLVLLVEDDEAIVEVVKLGLSYETMDCVVARDGVEAVRLHHETQPDIVVLDLMLPQLDGLTVLQRIRSQRETPVIVLTARDAPDDRVAGLQAGADDYLTKPFHFPELVARIRAVLRRQTVVGDGSVLEVGDLRIDHGAREVRVGRDKVDLTTRQFEVLALLASNAKRVLSKEQIYERVWGWDHMGNPNVVEQHISHLRDKIDRGRARRLIHTIRGVGYVLREES